MAEINVSNLTFCYEGSYDNIFEQVSFCINSNWKLGFIGRNGKGKTTFLNLLLGKYQYQGSIHTSVCFDYFPYEVSEEKMDWNTIDVIQDYIDIFSRMQIENLILKYQPTMLIVEHDKIFANKVATKVIHLE